MVPEGGPLRRMSPACTSGAAAEAQERRLRWGGSGAEAPLALRGFGRRSTACAAGGGSGAGAPLALRGARAQELRSCSDGTAQAQEPRLRSGGVAQAQESRLRSGGMTQARSPACAPRAVAGRMKLACAPGAGAQEPRSCSGSCSAVAAGQPSAPPRATTDVGLDRAAADKGAARSGAGCPRVRYEQPTRARRAPGDAHEAHSPAPGADAPHPYCRTSSSTSVVSRSRVWRSRASTLRRRRGSVLEGRRLNHQSGVVTVRPSRVSVVAAGWSA